MNHSRIGKIENLEECLRMEVRVLVFEIFVRSDVGLVQRVCVCVQFVSSCMIHVFVSSNSKVKLVTLMLCSSYLNQ